MEAYGKFLTGTIEQAPQMPLDTGAAVAWPERELLRSEPAAAFELGSAPEPGAAALCEAGLLVHYNQIDAAHAIVAERSDPSGCLWHAIIHRREGDYPNARYWVQRAGNHPVYSYIAQGAGAILAQMEGLNTTQLSAQINNWDATLFVKLCERALDERGALEQFCLQVQDLEWQVLFHYCHQQAVGAFEA